MTGAAVAPIVAARKRRRVNRMWAARSAMAARGNVEVGVTVGSGRGSHEPVLESRHRSRCRCASLAAFESCCGVTVAVRLLAIGTAPADIPLPQLGSGCGLWVRPDTIRVGQAPTFVLAIPPTLTPFTFYAQSSAIITNLLFSAPTVVTLSSGLALSLQ